MCKILMHQTPTKQAKNKSSNIPDVQTTGTSNKKKQLNKQKSIIQCINQMCKPHEHQTPTGHEAKHQILVHVYQMYKLLGYQMPTATSNKSLYIPEEQSTTQHHIQVKKQQGSVY